MKFLVQYILPIIGFFISFTLFTSSNQAGYERYFVIPLVFSIYILVDKEIYERAFANVGFAIFFLTGCFRYLLTPFVGCLSNYSVLFGMIPSPTEYREAVNLLIYEEISIIIFFFFYLRKKFYNVKEYKQKNVLVATITKKSLLKFMCVLALLTVIAFPQMFENIHFAGNLSSIDLAETIVINVPFAGLFTEIFSLGRFFAVLLIMEYLYKKSNRNGSYKFAIFVSMGIIFLNASFVTNLSRFGIIVPIISYTYLLMNLYKKQKELIVSTMFAAVISVVVIMSAVKFFSEDRNSANYESNDVVFWGETLQTYFMGVKETAVGIHAESQIDMVYPEGKIFLFLNDVFSNVIGLSNFTYSPLNTVHIYNYVYFPRVKSVSQIPPNIINGMYYFGRWGAPIFTLFFIFMFSFLDFKARKTKNIIYKFALLYGALYSGLCMMINGSMLCASLANDTLIILLYSKLNFLIAKK